jgi:hypothetical protein
MSKHPGREAAINIVVDGLDAVTPDLEDTEAVVGTPPDPPPNERLEDDG